MPYIMQADDRVLHYRDMRFERATFRSHDAMHGCPGDFEAPKRVENIDDELPELSSQSS